MRVYLASLLMRLQTFYEHRKAFNAHADKSNAVIDLVRTNRW